MNRSTYADRHARGPPVGRVELITFPAESTAAQNERDGHETAINAPRDPRAVLLDSTRIAFQLDAFPAGSVETNRREAPNATHNDEAHETPRNPPGLPVRTTDQAPVLGLRDTTTSPASSTATHKLTDEHETLNTDLTPSEKTTLHDEAGPAGLVDAITPPASSTATHNLTDGQETPSSSPRVANG